MGRSSAGARHPHARASTDHRPRPRRDHPRWDLHRTRKAWSGTGPITNVEVSFTGEGDWYTAQVEPPRGPYQWQDWSFTWEAAEPGRYSLRARATDAAGNVQPHVPPWNRLGYGNNAIEVPYVDVH